MASFVHNNWKGHFGISVSELCFKNALGLLINDKSNFWEERIIIRKIAVTFREERIITRKFGMNHRAKRIIVWKIAWIKTIGVTKMEGNFVEISFQAKFLWKAKNFVEICLHYFCTILYLPEHQTKKAMQPHFKHGTWCVWYMVIFTRVKFWQASKTTVWKLKIFKKCSKYGIWLCNALLASKEIVGKLHRCLNALWTRHQNWFLWE